MHINLLYFTSFQKFEIFFSNFHIFFMTFACLSLNRDSSNVIQIVHDEIDQTNWLKMTVADFQHFKGSWKIIHISIIQMHCLYVYIIIKYICQYTSNNIHYISIWGGGGSNAIVPP